MKHTRAGHRLDGKVAIVTGASRGIGLGITEALVEAGAAVVLVSRSALDLEKTADRIRSMGGQSLVLPLDVTAPESADTAVQMTLKHFGQIDILVMSAGVAVTRPAFEITQADWDKVLDLNLRAAFFWSQAVGRQMVDRGGRIIHLASVTGVVGVPGLAAYCTSKGGLIALTKALAVEWARTGITVNALAPGYVHTALNEVELADERVLGSIIRRTPMRRLGTVGEVGDAAVFLASDAAAFITGHVLAVDGGWLAG